MFVREQNKIICFKRVTYKNFKSVGNQEITIELNKSKTTLISGANGTGKTTALSAICFALFSRDYGTANRNQLINSINQKHCLVTIEFSIGRKNFVVKRGIKPNIFEIYENGKLRKKSADVRDDQKILEQQILKFNYRAFTQVVVMGSGYYVPFMRLPTWQRREIIEDLLDIRIFSVMYRILFEKMKKTKEELKDIDLEVKSTKEKVKMQENFIEKIKKERSDDAVKKQEEVSRLLKENEKYQKMVDKNQTAVDTLNEKYKKYESANEKFSDIRRMQKSLEQKIEESSEKKEFYKESPTCPTCKQDIHADYRENIIRDVEIAITGYEKEIDHIKKSMEKVKSDLEKSEKILEDIASHNKEISKYNGLIVVNNALVKRSNVPVDSGVNDILDTEKSKLKEFARVIIALDKKKKRILEDQQYQDLSSVMLQDAGIKAKIIKQYIPKINKLINKYLGALDFFVSFHLDENFDETVKSRYRDEFTYESFSEGQKLRIDLALTFAWREVARMKNSVNTNLLFMDEVLDGSLDQTGIDLFMGLLDKVNINNIFIISHRDIGDKFEATIKFTTKNNFTLMEK